MSTTRIDSEPARLTIDASRPRQTAAPRTPFRDVLAGGASILVSGAAIATSVLGGPVLAAAVREASGEAAGTGRPSTFRGPGPTVGGHLAGAPGSATEMPGGSSEMTTMHAMQRESQTFNLQLLALQEEVQQENRHFTTVSNVLRAKHDTAKAAVANIRS